MVKMKYDPESFTVQTADCEIPLATVLDFDCFPCSEEEDKEEINEAAHRTGRLFAESGTLFEIAEKLIEAEDTEHGRAQRDHYIEVVTRWARHSVANVRGEPVKI